MRDLAQDHPVVVSADNSRNLWMRADYRRKPVRAQEPNAIEQYVMGQKRGVMQRHQRRPLRRRRKGVIEPMSQIRREFAVGLPGSDLIERDDAHWERLDRKGQMTRSGQVFVRWKSFAQLRPVVMVAGQKEERCGRVDEGFRKRGVFVGLLIVHEIAREQDHIGAIGACALHCASQLPQGCAAVIYANMRVRNLRKDEPVAQYRPTMFRSVTSPPIRPETGSVCARGHTTRHHSGRAPWSPAAVARTCSDTGATP